MYFVPRFKKSIQKMDIENGNENKNEFLDDPNRVQLCCFANICRKWIQF